jgi:putative alpha-1,2-mannosidase
MGNGKQLIILGENASKDNVYIQSCTINDKPWDKPWFRYSDIKNGAVIKFVMTKKK